MTEARDRLNLLPVSYPRLFRDGPLTWGFEHGAGWADLIIALCERLSTILKDDPNAILTVLQVKEKFGELRFYYRLEGGSDATSQQVRQAVDLASAASVNVCESCGRSSELRIRDGWYTTRCSRCSQNDS